MVQLPWSRWDLSYSLIWGLFMIEKENRRTHGAVRLNAYPDRRSFQELPQRIQLKGMPPLLVLPQPVLT